MDIKEVKQTAENTIEDVLHALHEQGVKVHKIQLITYKDDSPQVNLVLHERNGVV